MTVFHFLYRVTHLPSGRYYLGKHTTANMEDGYLGSGTVWKHILRAHPATEFSRQELGFFDSKQAVAAAERELITEAVLQDPLCRNETLGGQGGDARNFWKNSSAQANARKAASTLKASALKLAKRNRLIGQRQLDRLQADPAALDAHLQKMHAATRGTTKDTAPWIKLQVEARQKNHTEKMNQLYQRLRGMADLPVATLIDELGVSRSTIMRMRAKVRQGAPAWSTNP